MQGDAFSFRVQRPGASSDTMISSPCTPRDSGVPAASRPRGQRPDAMSNSHLCQGQRHGAVLCRPTSPSRTSIAVATVPAQSGAPRCGQRWPTRRAPPRPGRGRFAGRRSRRSSRRPRRCLGERQPRFPCRRAHDRGGRQVAGRSRRRCASGRCRAIPPELPERLLGLVEVPVREVARVHERVRRGAGTRSPAASCSGSSGVSSGCVAKRTCSQTYSEGRRRHHGISERQRLPVRVEAPQEAYERHQPALRPSPHGSRGSARRSRDRGSRRSARTCRSRRACGTRRSSPGIPAAVTGPAIPTPS